MTDEQQQPEISPRLIRKNKRRYLSQTPVPSHGLSLKKLSEGYITISDMRYRRTVSEQINRHDR
jgi:hypothetical protein